MDRILVLMTGNTFTDTVNALRSARSAARNADAISWGLLLENEPDNGELTAMNALGAAQYLAPAMDPWRDMPLLWSGESHVLLAHPAMRFTKNWDAALLRALDACSREERREHDRDMPVDPAAEAAEAAREALPVSGHVLTGYLPNRDDPMNAVCPVAADAMTPDGVITFRRGVPLSYAKEPEPAPFLHPGFCFGPAGFFRAMAEGDDTEPLFLRAFRGCWALHTLHEPLIKLIWEMEVAPCSVAGSEDLTEEFLEETGVSLTEGTLSPQARRGMLRRDLKLKRRFPLSVRAREKGRQWQRSLKGWYDDLMCDLKKKKRTRILPRCVTHLTAGLEEECACWLEQLSGLRNLHLIVYAEPVLVRRVAEYAPDVLEYKTRYLMEAEAQDPAALIPLSKVSLLAAARERSLTPSHYVWVDPDGIQYPLYQGCVFQWEALCRDRIMMATLGGVPDPTMFVVPEAMVLTLAREMEARCIALMHQKGELPTETELWKLVIRNHPEWFELIPMPVEKQLFTRLIRNT